MEANNLPAYLNKLSHKQRLACEMMAVSPKASTQELADAVGVSKSTIENYKSKAVFNEAVYKRFMDVSSGRLTSVVDSMIREAERGNVQAATLVLKHYGKFEDKVTIRIESPFEKFLKMGKMDDAVIVNGDDAKEIVGGSFEIQSDLPERDPVNDKPIMRKKAENKKIKAINEESFTAEHRLKRRNSAYMLRKRAEAVGLPKMAPGRQRENVRREWMEELRSREKLAGIK